MVFDKTRISPLGEAVLREGETAEGLARHLREARLTLARTPEAKRLGSTLADAKKLADALTQTGALRMRLTTEVARALGLPSKSSLATVAEALGELGAALRLGARRLREQLETLSQESAALGIFSRHGAAVAGHLADLASPRTVYGPTRGGAHPPPGRGFAV